MKEKLFSKDDTWAVKGVAILFMYWHHCFLDRSRFEGCTVDFFPLPEELAIYIAAFFKICVGMFAFLSAYGMTVSTRQRYSDISLGRSDVIKSTFSRWFSLMQGWIFVFVLCELITFMIDRRPLEIYGTGTRGVINFMIDFAGLADIFQTPLLIATWWYMSLAIVIIILMPILLKMYTYFGVLLIPVAIVLPQALGLDITNLVRWFLAVVLGIVFAEEKVFERAGNWLLGRKKILKFIGFIAVFILMVMFRQSKMGAEFLYIMDGIVPAYIILLLYVYVIHIPVLQNILVLLGKHSMNMFLIHNFVRVVYLYEWTYSFKFAFLDVLVLVIETLFLSIMIEKLKDVCKYNMLCSKIKKGVLNLISSRCN